jgi:uncharacterized protein
MTPSALFWDSGPSSGPDRRSRRHTGFKDKDRNTVTDTIVIDKNIRVPMRDGVELATDIYRRASGDPAPVLLQRLPYNKELPAGANLSVNIQRAVQSGYVVVVQDTRGRFQSGGEFNPFFDEAADGVDTIEWAASQPWSDGSVGMIGGSYFGATQCLPATEAPGALKAIAPLVTASDYHEGWAYRGGAFELGFNLQWTIAVLAMGEIQRRVGTGNATMDDVRELVSAADSIDDLYQRLPIRDMPPLANVAPYYFDWLDHPDYDDFWRQIAPKERHNRMATPALHIGGWYDIFITGTLDNYRGMSANAATEEARRAQRLVVGPWAHGVFGGAFADQRYGLLASSDGFDLTGAHMQWFDHWLKGIDNGVADEKPVRIFVMGANTWRSEDDWPLPDTRYVPYYLHSGGRANTRSGDGSLSTEEPGDQPEDVYLYDPRNPVPTCGGATFLPGLQVGANAGPRDQRNVETRSDVLCYTTEPLPEAIEVTGHIELVLFASSSAFDTDFTGKLVDVAPDGTATILSDGILRARYRASMSEQHLLEPGEVCEFRIDLGATSNRFHAGHRIRLDISSSNFPRFDRNTNTGGVIADDGPDDLMQAVNRVFHDRARPSHLILPVVDR